MAVRRIVLLALIPACTTADPKPFKVDATIAPLEVTVPVANYGQPPLRADFTVKNNMGSVLYISPAIPTGDGADLLSVDVPAYTQVVPGQTKPVQVTLDYRPWRWKTGDYTAIVPFEVRYFFSGQAPDEAEQPSTTSKAKNVVDVLNLTVHFSINCDLDGDGQDAWQCGGPDCDDTRATTYQGATEICDGRDQDCDGAIDDNATGEQPWWLDNDGDSFGDPATLVNACNRPSSDYINIGQDCDDDDAAVNPNQFENCTNHIDDDCDGLIDGDDLDDCD